MSKKQELLLDLAEQAMRQLAKKQSVFVQPNEVGFVACCLSAALTSKPGEMFSDFARGMFRVHGFDDAQLEQDTS